MAVRNKNRFGRRFRNFRVIRPDGSEKIVTEAEFNINVELANLIRDKKDRRLAQVPDWLSVTEEDGSGRLMFESRTKGARSQPVKTSTKALLENWLRDDPTITNQQARARMLLSLPRVWTETICLY